MNTMNSSVNPVVNKVNSNSSNDPGHGGVPGELVQAVIVVDINVGSSNVTECQRSEEIILLRSGPCKCQDKNRSILSWVVDSLAGL